MQTAMDCEDFDGGEDTDVAAASFSECVVRWYENDGKGSYTTHAIDTGQHVHDAGKPAKPHRDVALIRVEHSFVCAPRRAHPANGRKNLRTYRRARLPDLRKRRPIGRDPV